MSLAWKRERRGGSRGLPLNFGTGSPRAITRKSSLTRTIFQLSNSSLLCSCNEPRHNSDKPCISSHYQKRDANLKKYSLIFQTIRLQESWCVCNVFFSPFPSYFSLLIFQKFLLGIRSYINNLVQTGIQLNVLIYICYAVISTLLIFSAGRRLLLWPAATCHSARLTSGSVRPPAASLCSPEGCWGPAERSSQPSPAPPGPGHDLGSQPWRHTVTKTHQRWREKHSFLSVISATGHTSRERVRERERSETGWWWWWWWGGGGCWSKSDDRITLLPVQSVQPQVRFTARLCSMTFEPVQTSTKPLPLKTIDN